MPDKDNFLVGVISDTHGLLEPEVLRVFKGVDLIIHAGDIDRPEILEQLENTAPVKAVRGNMDRGGWATTLPPADVVHIGGVYLYILHDLYRLDLDPIAAGFSAVISGHTHKSHAEMNKGIFFLNPGSAGDPRHEPASVALLRIRGTELDAQIIRL